MSCCPENNMGVGMKNNCFLLFSDIKGFSKLTENQFEVFAAELIPEVYKKLGCYIEKSLAWNTWGDAVFAAFENPSDVVDFAINYRDFFNSSVPSDLLGIQLKPRIACHFGEATLVNDPTLGKKNLFGKNVNAAARLEPSTRPGEIFVTREFQEACGKSPSFNYDVSFDPVGRIVCAKAFGELDAFRMRKSVEPTQAIDWLSSLDLAETLPSPPETPESILPIFESLRSLEPSAIASVLDAMVRSPAYEGDTLLQIAAAYQCSGMYSEALATIDKLENYTIDVDGLRINPYKSRIDAQKIKANSLTRIGRYDEAANVVYTMWSSGHRDADTLSMLAGQYKRRAIYGTHGKLLKEIGMNDVNGDLIDRSQRLYVEAFRLDLDNFYPAINAAYLYKMFGGKYAGAGGTKLAQYILSAWSGREGESWWLDATLAEAELLLDDYPVACSKLVSAVSNHSPGTFEIMATCEQINLYAHFMRKNEEINDIISCLKWNFKSGEQC